MNSENIRLTQSTLSKPLVNCMMSEHTGGKDMIGEVFDLSSSGRRATAALLHKLRSAGLQIEEIRQDESAFGAEIVGKEQIARYIELGGKIFGPTIGKGLEDFAFTFRTGAEGTILECAASGSVELARLAVILDRMGVPYQTVDNMLRVDDPVGIRAVAISGGKFQGDKQYLKFMSVYHREFWVQGGNDLLQKQTGMMIISVVRLPGEDDDKFGDDDRGGNIPKDPAPPTQPQGGGREIRRQRHGLEPRQTSPVRSH